MNGTVMSVPMEKNYTLRGKCNHLKSKKHERNYNKTKESTQQPLIVF